MKPFISIIIPVYNGKSTIDRCLSSIISQQYSDYEIIMIDDGSTDGSYDVLSGYANESIKVVKKENGGVSSARNLGIELSSGEYLLFVDCDDALADRSLEKFVSEAKSSSHDLISSAIAVIKNGEKSGVIGYDEDRRFSDEIFSSLLRAPEKFGYAGGKMVKRSLIVDNGLKFDTNMKTQEDLSFFLDVYALGHSFVFLSFEGYNYHIQHDERSIPLYDNVKNRVKAILLAEKKCSADKDALKTASDMVLYTVYSYLCYAKTREEIASLLMPLLENTKIKAALQHRTRNSKYEYIAHALISSRLASITRRFLLRAKIKRLIGR